MRLLKSYTYDGIALKIYTTVQFSGDDIMFVDNFSMSRVVVVVVVSGSEERLEVCHEKESDRVLLFLVGEFQLTILGVGILDLLR